MPGARLARARLGTPPGMPGAALMELPSTRGGMSRAPRPPGTTGWRSALALLYVEPRPGFPAGPSERQAGEPVEERFERFGEGGEGVDQVGERRERDFGANGEGQFGQPVGSVRAEE